MFCTPFQNSSKNHPFCGTKKYFVCNAQTPPKSATTSAARSALECASPLALFPRTSTRIHPRYPPDFIGHFPRLPVFRPEFQSQFPPPIPLINIPLTVPIQTFSVLLWVFCAISLPRSQIPPPLQNARDQICNPIIRQPGTVVLA